MAIINTKTNKQKQVIITAGEDRDRAEFLFTIGRNVISTATVEIRVEVPQNIKDSAII
jgi:hypothetical protein